jgi:hypothetical protein
MPSSFCTNTCVTVLINQYSTVLFVSYSVKEKPNCTKIIMIKSRVNPSLPHWMISVLLEGCRANNTFINVCRSFQPRRRGRETASCGGLTLTSININLVLKAAFNMFETFCDEFKKLSLRYHGNNDKAL